MEASGQELIEGTIAREISSVNHRPPWPLAPPINGRVKLSNDQKSANKRATDMKCYWKRKRNEEKMMGELEKLEKYSGQLHLESDELKRQKDQTEALVEEEYNIMISELDGNYAGQNTEVRKARINEIGEMSMGQDGLNEPREVNLAPTTSNSISGGNVSMNLQTRPRSAQPARCSGLADDKTARRRIADKERREEKKLKLDEAAARIKELNEQNVELESKNAVLKAEANLLRKHLEQLRNIRKRMNLKNARRNARLEKVLEDFMLPFVVTGSGTGETALPVHHPPAHQSGTTIGTGGLAVEGSPGLPQSHVSQEWTHPPSFGTWEQGSTSFNEDMEWLMDGYIVSLGCQQQETGSELEPPSHD